MVKIPNQRIRPTGNSFCVAVPKALVNCEIISENKDYDLYLVPKGTTVKIKNENSELLIRTTDRQHFEEIAYSIN